MSRPYVDRPVGDAEGSDRAARAAAERWGLEPPVLLRRAMNAIHRCGDVVVRVAVPTAPAERSLELARLLAERGVAVPAPARDDAVVVDGFSVTAWEHVEASGDPVDWPGVGAAVRAVHDLDPGDLPAGLPRPSPLELPWWDHEALLAEVEPDLDDEAASGLRAALDRHRGWRDRLVAERAVVCHGDVHPGNVVQAAVGPVLLDWDLLCLAPPAWDHAPLMTWTERWGGEAGIYEAFADGYGCDARDDELARSLAELRLVSATLMACRAARADRSARAEVDRRLALWRGDPSAPTWRAR